MDEDSINQLTNRTIGCAIAVHKVLGPGLLESLYENAMCIEMAARSLRFESQKVLPVCYKERFIGDFKLDLVVESTLVLELKAIERHSPLFEAQLLSYMKLRGYPIGLIINFNSSMLKDGIRRFRL